LNDLSYEHSTQGSYSAPDGWLLFSDDLDTYSHM